jgi:hypothetical protein
MSIKDNVRSASASLLGYHYQLDKALIEILSCDASDAEITVEGVEDIDVLSCGIYNAIQCKYLAAQKCIPSVLREPVQLMLLEFNKDTSRLWTFRLYAHFGIAGSQPALDVPALKSMLTYTSDKVEHRFHEENHLTDDTLERFLRCFTIIPGPSHEDQQRQVLRLVERMFGATPTEASNFLYPKALAVILRAATRSSQNERVVRPESFREEIRQASTSVISPWLIRALGPERAYRFIRQSISGSGLFRSSTMRTIVMDLDDSSEPGLVQVTFCDFLAKLTDRSFKAGVSLRDALPWTVVVNTTPDLLMTQKRYLLAKGIRFNDGYEHVEFSRAMSSEAPVVNRAVKNGKTTYKLGRSSYALRLVTFASIAPHLASISLGDTLLCTSDQDVQLKVSAACGTKVNIGSQWSRGQILGLFKA